MGPFIHHKADYFEGTFLFAVLSIGLILRLFILLSAPAIELDGIAYATMGEAFSRGNFHEALNNVFSPMYPFFTGLLHLAVPDVELAGRLVSLASGLVLICVCFFFSRRLFNDCAKAFLVALLLAFHPYMIRYSGFVLSESLATLLFTVTVFSFYKGWQADRWISILVSGLCLAMTYLTRPEYLIFYVPFTLLLLYKRRFAHTALLLLPLLVLGSIYVLHIRIESGLWMVSRKATLSPFVSLGRFFTNMPSVLYSLFLAVFPVLFLFAVLGVKRVAPHYRKLILILVVFHILSLSFISHSTRRYSVEFIPIIMVFAVEGLYVAVEYLKRFLRKPRVAGFAVGAIVILPSLFQAYTVPGLDRGVHKQAGIYLLELDPGSAVASRLPIIPFYEKGRWIDLYTEMSHERTLSRFLAVAGSNNVKYLAFDEEIEKDLPFLKEYLSCSTPVKQFREKEYFIRLYRLESG
jgi:hypothetical protein